MKYAVISDIHGNIDALKAVLVDATAHEVDHFVFVGDYCSYLPYPNEVVDVIRAIDNKTIIKGNEEDYFAVYRTQDPATWTDGQFQAHYWCYHALRRDTMDYLLSLPDCVQWQDGATALNAAHASYTFYGDLDQSLFSGVALAQKYRNDRHYTHDFLLRSIQDHLQSAAPVVCERLPQVGVYLFGHTHVQWHAEVEGRLLINPGSCGLPTDGLGGAPYTLLTVDSGACKVVERRVPYDFDGMLARFKDSSLFQAALIWCSIIERELRTHFEHVHDFLRYIHEYAERIGDTVRPYSVQTWTEAYRCWCATTGCL